MWDARYLSWAPQAPAWAWLVEGPRPPLTSWGRRPGWHRSAVRLAATALVVAVVLAPVVTAAALVGAAIAGVPLLVAARRGALGPSTSPTAPTAPSAAWAVGEAPAWPWLEDGEESAGRGRSALPGPVHVDAIRLDRAQRHEGGERGWVR